MELESDAGDEGDTGGEGLEDKELGSEGQEQQQQEVEAAAAATAADAGQPPTDSSADGAAEAALAPSAEQQQQQGGQEEQPAAAGPAMPLPTVCGAAEDWGGGSGGLLAFGAVLGRLEEEDPIARRTRAHHCLNDITLEELEQMLQVRGGKKRRCSDELSCI